MTVPRGPDEGPLTETIRTEPAVQLSDSCTALPGGVSTSESVFAELPPIDVNVSDVGVGPKESDGPGIGGKGDKLPPQPAIKVHKAILNVKVAMRCITIAYNS